MTRTVAVTLCRDEPKLNLNHCQPKNLTAVPDNPFKSGKEDRRPPQRYQFGMATLFFLAIPVGLLAGAWSILTRHKPGEPMHWFGLGLVAAAPLALAFVVSLYQKLRR